MPNQTRFIVSPLALPMIATVLALSLTACATQRYGRMTAVSPGERASLNCEQIALEIEKANFFIADVRQQRSETTGAHVLGALGDFGIGNVMEGDAAEKSGTDRLNDLTALQVGKGCKTTEAAAVLMSANETSARCAESKDSEKPWIGNWNARNGKAVLRLAINDTSVNGDLKVAGGNFLIRGGIDDLGAMRAALVGGRDHWDRIDLKGTFPRLKVTSASSRFAVIRGAVFRLCS